MKVNRIIIVTLFGLGLLVAGSELASSARRTVLSQTLQKNQFVSLDDDILSKHKVSRSIPADLKPSSLLVGVRPARTVIQNQGSSVTHLRTSLAAISAGSPMSVITQELSQDTVRFGIAAMPGDPASRAVMSGGAVGNMTYHGGPVQHSQKVFTIFWSPSGYSFPAGFQTTINQFVQDLNGSSYYGIASQYGDSTGNISTSVVYGGTWLDTSNAFPSTSLSFSDLTAELNRAKAANGWTSDGNSYFQIYTPSGIGTSAGTNYCGLHWGANPAVGQILLRPSACSPPPPYPNNQTVDAAINTSAHEIMETVTDPLLNAWYYVDGTGEIGDLCNFQFGAIASDGSNVILNGHHYIIQQEWSNSDGGCTLSSAGACSSGTSSLRNRDGGPPIHPPGSLLKVASDPTVYLIDPDNRKRAITSASVLAQLYNQSTDARTGTNFSTWVITVGQDELDLYEQGGNISAAQPGNGMPFPDGKLIGYNGEVSIVTGVGKRRPFVSSSTFTGLGFNFCQVVNVSASEYNSYPVGPPVDAMALLTSSVNLSPAGPYTVGQNISGTFTIKNVGYASIPFSSLGIGGRLNGSTVYDISFVSTTLAAGSSYQFNSQAVQLTSAGTYDFFAAYQETNTHWAISVPAAPGVVRSRQITVTSTTTRTLTVSSSNPSSGVSITVSPNDNNNQGSGTTQFTRTYNNNVNVNLTAPSTASGNSFQKWQRDGSDWSTNQSTSVTMDGNHTMTAVYVTPPTTRTLTVASSNPSSGVSITVSPTDNNGQGSGITQFTRVYNNNTNMSLTAPSTAGGNTFQKWQLDGVDLTTSLLANFVMNANHTITAVYVTAGTGNAVYDSTLKAPKCGQAGSLCNSGTLLTGRDNITGGSEPNQPNTINNSCADGTSGTFHSDESIDAIKVSTLDGGNFAPGKAVRIDVNYWVWSTSADYLDIFYAGDATNPNWIYLGTFQPPGTGAQILTTTYQMPNGGSLQAVRAVFRFGGSASSCGSNSGYDDHDDLIFATSTAPIAGLQYYPLPFPVRLLDTRPGEPACFTPGTPLNGNTSRTQVVTGSCGGLVIPATAKAIVANGAVVNTLPGAIGGYLNVYPSGVPRPVAANVNYAAGAVVSNGFTVGLGGDGAFNIYASSTLHFVVDITGYYAPPGQGGLYYHPLPRPVRLLDTRSGQPACDNPGSPILGGTARAEFARIVCSGLVIPADALAIVGNGATVNTLPGAGGGYITLYPGGVSRPTTANVNYAPGQIVSNAFTVGIGTNGAFNIFASSTVDYVVDVTGYYNASAAVDSNGVSGLLYYPLASPMRLLDTRPGQPACTNPGSPLLANSVRTQVARTTCSGLTVPSTALSVIGNAAVVNNLQGANGGYVTLFPSGLSRPVAANVNYVAGQVVSNSFTVGLGSDGAFNIYASSTIDIVIDTFGYFGP